MKTLVFHGMFLSGVLMLVLLMIVLLSVPFRAHAAADHVIPTSEAELFERVTTYNAGWDYVPYCGDDAYWSISDNACKGGTDSDSRSVNHDQDGYGITGPAHLSQKVKEVNAGWDWVPRCPNGSHWSFNDHQCEGGSDDD